MIDRITTGRRSWNMSRIRGKDTKPELAVRSALHRMGYRFRIHRKDLPGNPDIVLARYRTVIFVHGCYWHRHSGCGLTYTPKSRTDFWEKKFSGTIARDRKNREALIMDGWRVEVIWECETKELDVLQQCISRLLQDH